MRSAPQTDKYDLNSAWYFVLTGPLTWSVYFLVGYGLIEAACKAGLLEAQLLGLTVLSLVILALTLVALLVTLYAGFVAYRNWRPIGTHRELAMGQGPVAPMGQNADDRPSRPDEDAGRFMGFAGVLLNALFSLLILVTGLPALVLNPCG